MANDGVEVWRGGVNPWECDIMGHLNVRYYVSRAGEGLAGLAAALGMPAAFRERAASTLQVREHHIRFVREARAGDPLHMTAGVLSVDDDSALVQFLLRHSRTGELSAGIQARVAHVTSHDGQAFPWSERARALASGLAIEAPAKARPRSLADAAPAHVEVSLAHAEKIGLAIAGRSAVRPQDCDVFGRLQPEGVMARLSDGFSQWWSAPDPDGDGQALGVAAVEMRLRYLAWPRAGDHVVLRSGLKSVTAKSQSVAHWLLDPITGQPWATSEHVFVGFDLDRRRHAELSPKIVAAMLARVTPGLTG
jgi:acyl-CoA thioester hydrolase